VAVALRAFRRHSLEERVHVLRDGVELVDYLESRDLRARPPKLILLDSRCRASTDARRCANCAAVPNATSRRGGVVVDQQSDVRECYELGANSFVVKQLNPGSRHLLVDTVRYWLDMNEVAS